MNIKGFEVRLNKNREGQSLYITNRLETGKVSIIIGDERPSVADVQHISTRWDVSEKAFAELWKRVEHKVEQTEEAYTVTEEPDFGELREGMIETPEIRETPEKAVRTPKARKPRKPRVVIHD